MLVNDADYLAQLNTSTRFLIRGVCTLADNTSVTLGYDDFSIDNNTYSEGANMNSLPIGAVLCKSMQLELDNYEGSFDGIDFNGATIAIYADFDVDGTTESTSLGTYYVNSPVTVGRYITITAVDAMYKADTPYNTTVGYPSTVMQIFSDVLTCCGLTTDLTSFPQSTLTIEAGPGTAYTCRQMLAFMAEIAGGAFRIVNGKVAFKAIDLVDNNTTPVFTLDNFFELEIDMTASEITGIAVSTVEETENGTLETVVVLQGTEGYVINLSAENPFIAGNVTSILTALGTQFIGKTFYRFTGEHTGCPILEFGDVVEIVGDDEDVSYVSFITDYTYEFGGESNFINSAQSAMGTGLKYASPQEQIATESSLRKASITKSENEIKMYVGEQTTYVKNGLEEQIAAQSTEITQLSDSINIDFKKVIDDNASELKEIKKYIRFENGNIILGESGNELTLEISNGAITFKQGGTDVAWFTNNQLVVNTSQFNQRMNLGNFAFIPNETVGNLTFKKVK